MTEEDETPLDELCHKAGYKCGREDMLKEVLELLRSEECLKAEWEAGWGHELSCKFLADWLENKLNEGKKE